MKEYYLKDRNRVRGPYMLDDLKYQRIKSNTLVKIDEGEWIRIAEESDLSFLLKVNSDYEISEHNERPVPKKEKGSKSAKLIIIFSFIIALLAGLAVLLLTA